MRVADWLRDPDGTCFAALGVPCGRRAADAGVFVIDGDGVLRLAYRASSTEEWIPAAFVLSRVRRLLPAEPEIRLLRTQLGAARGTRPARLRPGLTLDILGLRGAIAQLGERLDRTQEVSGSNPLSSMGIARPWRGLAIPIVLCESGRCPPGCDPGESLEEGLLSRRAPGGQRFESA